MSSGAAASHTLPSQRKEDPWQQEPNKSRARKRFSYKSKSNRTPLRGKLRQAEAARLVEESEKEAKLRAKKLHGEKKNHDRIDSVKELQTMTQTTAERTPDHILLRKSQLSNILLTLAKLEGSETNIQFDAENPSLLKGKLDTQQGNSVTDREENQLESVLNLSKRVITGSDTPCAYQLKKSDNQTHHHANRTRPKGRAMEPDGKRGINQTNTKMMTENTVQPAHAPANEDKVFVRGPSKVVTIIGETIIDESKNVDKIVDECSPKAPSIESQSEEMLKHKQEMTLSPRQKQLLLPRAHMTKAERKRLQWELEKESLTTVGKANESSMLSSTRSNNALQAKNELSGSSKESSKLAVEMDKQTTNHQKQSAFKTSVVEPVYVPGLGQVDDQAIKYSDDNANSAGAQYIRNQYNLMRDGPVHNTVPSKYPLSKAQIKRLQWEKEKDELVEYDPWGRAGVGVGPHCHRPGDNQLKGYTPLNFQPSQSDRNTEPVIQLADYTGLTGSRNQPSIETPTGVSGLNNGTRESNKPDTVGNLSLTKAQRLRLKWQQERESGIDEYNPYGKPGAGAPIRTESGSILTNYHDRQKQMMKQSIEYSDTKMAQQSDDTHLPSRSHQHSQHTAWVDQENTSNVSRPTDDLQTHDTDTDHSLGSHIRRRLVNLDPQTLKEREEQRKREKIYQDEIRHQVEENERLRREEKLRKVQEEAEEEAKLKAHRKDEIRQHETAALRTNQSEIKEMSRVDIVAESMQRARQEAEFLKAQKRLEKLKAAGHDISHLKATYEVKFSPRMGHVIPEFPSYKEGAAGTTPTTDTPSKAHYSMVNKHSIEPHSVPGLEMSPRAESNNDLDSDLKVADGNGEIPVSSKFSELGVQTEASLWESGTEKDTGKAPIKSEAESSKRRKQVRIISGPKVARTKEPRVAKPWGYKNNSGKKFTVQSQRDLQYKAKQDEKEESKMARKEVLLKQVEANKKLLPGGILRKENLSLAQDGKKVSSTPRKGLPDVNTSQRKTLSRMAGTADRSEKVGSDIVTGSIKSPTHHSQQAPMTMSPSELEAKLSYTTDEVIPTYYVGSEAVLGPSHAHLPSPMSREATQAAMAREAYHKHMQPAQYGVHMHNIRDIPATQTIISPSSHSKDPLLNPAVVMKHPTERQLQVLQSLRQMRQGLMAKQREIESVSDIIF